MGAKLVMRLAAVAIVVAGIAGTGVLGAQSKGGSAESVRIPRGVTANGQSLAAGTYTLRLSSEAVSPVVGQAATGEKWVEFVQGGQVKGKELASVVAAPDAKEVLKQASPAPGTTRVEALRGGDYVRIWFNEDGTQYLVHLAAEKK